MIRLFSQRFLQQQALPSRGIRLVSATSRLHATLLNDPNVYEELSSYTLEALSDYFDRLGDEIDLDDYDSEMAAGVLTVSLGSKGTFVINKQSPNRQIWLSSPLSGPKRYDFDVDQQRWVYTHDNIPLDERLATELSQLLKRDIALPPFVSKSNKSLR